MEGVLLRERKHELSWLEAYLVPSTLSNVSFSSACTAPLERTIASWKEERTPSKEREDRRLPTGAPGDVFVKLTSFQCSLS